MTPPGFSEFTFRDGDITHTVFRSKANGAGVLIMHELPGMTPQCISLATRVVDAGFTVFLPLLVRRTERQRDGCEHISSVCEPRIQMLGRTRNQPDYLLAKGVEQKDSR